MSVSNRAILTFEGSDGVVRLSVPRARLDMTLATATVAMENIIASNAVHTVRGVPLAVKGATFISTERVRII